MDFDTIRYEVADGLCRSTLDRPRRIEADEAFRAFVEKRAPVFR
jgi:hypothetical protein